MNKEILDKLSTYIENNNFSGWDPYDGLNSPILRALSFNKWGRIFWTQVIRRFPINLRKILFVPKGENPKGIGLFLEGYTKLYAVTKEDRYLKIVNRLLDSLEEHNCRDRFSGNCWGYNFPWQSRVVYRPIGTPTVVNTSFIGHALLNCYRDTGIEKAKELAWGIPNFLLKDLNRKEEGKTFCFSYTPIDQDFVHNANMLGSSLLMRLGKEMGIQEYVDIAHKALQYSISHQHTDGSWFFAEPSNYQWKDSFHTGFKLESIRYFINYGEGEAYKESYEKGRDYYFNNYFLEDGTPKYYDNKTYPVDAHAPSEAIYFFSGEQEIKYHELAQRVEKWSINHLWGEKEGFFYFRMTPKNINKIAYMRWTQGWFFRGLTENYYNENIGKSK